VRRKRSDRRESAAHTSVRDVVKKRILAPLGMTSTAYDIEDIDSSRLATPYKRGPTGLEPAAHSSEIEAFDRAFVLE
jgi:CubicO group peptidase (beta-lactamase class C family)